MIEGRPSRTALGAAMRRAAHQLLDHPPVFEDPCALPILGPEGAARVRREAVRPFARLRGRRLRAFLAARSRVAEDALSESYDRGVRQYVLLGAGLDTFSCRAGDRFPGLRIIEADHPDTQAWKRWQLREVGLRPSEALRFAPVDFTRDDLGAALALAGYDADRPAVFAWLGVSMYLEEEAVYRMLRWLAATAPGGTAVFDYLASTDALPFWVRWRARRSERRVAAQGEPWRSRFDPVVLRSILRGFEFGSVVDLGADELRARFFATRRGGLRGGGTGRIVIATVG